MHGSLAALLLSSGASPPQGLVFHFIEIRRVHHIPHLEDQKRYACHCRHQQKYQYDNDNLLVLDRLLNPFIELLIAAVGFQKGLDRIAVGRIIDIED